MKKHQHTKAFPFVTPATEKRENTSNNNNNTTAKAPSDFDSSLKQSQTLVVIFRKGIISILSNFSTHFYLDLSILWFHSFWVNFVLFSITFFD